MEDEDKVNEAEASQDEDCDSHKLDVVVVQPKHKTSKRVTQPSRQKEDKSDHLIDVAGPMLSDRGFFFDDDEVHLSKLPDNINSDYESNGNRSPSPPPLPSHSVPPTSTSHASNIFSMSQMATSSQAANRGSTINTSASRSHHAPSSTSMQKAPASTLQTNASTSSDKAPSSARLPGQHARSLSKLQVVEVCSNHACSLSMPSVSSISHTDSTLTALSFSQASASTKDTEAGDDNKFPAVHASRSFKNFNLPVPADEFRKLVVLIWCHYFSTHTDPWNMEGLVEHAQAAFNKAFPDSEQLI
ncbi:hypothetical protein EWM64_g5213 [Hericium alpestre]|uniref:Uncharacterized protein n=1 Tax=Hericium alpestre TaxID=135208 RepID=A0A4Y9ZXJ8_9AGAM|nr:hypothetical protein EWM64_g5213 [Hericium alpestre]